MQGKLLTAGDLPEAIGMEVTTQKGKRAKELPGERGRTEIGDVS